MCDVHGRPQVQTPALQGKWENELLPLWPPRLSEEVSRRVKQGEAELQATQHLYYSGSPGVSTVNLERVTKNYSRGWRAGSTVKSTCCSPGRPEFGFQHPHQAAHNHLAPAPVMQRFSSAGCLVKRRQGGKRKGSLRAPGPHSQLTLVLGG